ncbi:hypothetical protein CHN50_17590 [Priestia aryabhattai]|uniref:hypothetical protein n=1 Tax=Priestia TaxID=2800373 RepID=UPI000BA11DA5|nr:hypothetical protein [Priestia flexa]MDT2048110.1 hypothetical protein [Priestia flexa]OZT11216.1 hypothetical protein CHN50_17590 [Priestia aryabhattai]USY55801.1 hypothetical protein NIZ91_03855 [Bacillus sp. 1780r2a1]
MSQPSIFVPLTISCFHIIILFFVRQLDDSYTSLVNLFILLLTFFYVLLIQQALNKVMKVRACLLFVQINDLFFFILYMVVIFNGIFSFVNEQVLHSYRLFTLVCMIPFYFILIWLSLQLFIEMKRTGLLTVSLGALLLACYPLTSLILLASPLSSLLLLSSFISISSFETKQVHA